MGRGRETTEKGRRGLLFLGNHGVWGSALYGSQLRSERLASGLAQHYDVIYACMGRPQDNDEALTWQRRVGIKGLLIGEPSDARRSARWGRAPHVLRSVLPRRVPLEITERATVDFVRQLSVLTDRDSLVWAHRSWMAEAARRAGFRRIVCDIDDFEGVIAAQYTNSIQSLRTPLFRLLDSRLANYERRLSSRFRGVVITKEEDRTLAGGALCRNCHVVPNGFDLPALPPRQSEVPRRALFVGTLGYGPNIDAIRWFYSQILPRVRGVYPDLEFHVVGRGPMPSSLSDLLEDPLVLVEQSPLSLDAAYARAGVVVTPVRLGHGTRIKALEAAAYARPIVSTSECLRGHPIREGEHALVADSADDFALACIRVLGDSLFARRLGDNGRRLAESIGGWSRSVRLAKEVLDAI